MATETIIQKPAPFVEKIGEKLSEQALGLQNVPVVTTGLAGITRAAGETDQGFLDRQNAARAFEVRQQNLAGIAPQVADQGPLQTLAQAKTGRRASLTQSGCSCSSALTAGSGQPTLIPTNQRRWQFLQKEPQQQSSSSC